MNKQLLSILSIVISIGLALGIYLYFAQIDDTNIKPIQIIPDNAAFAIESNNSSQNLKNISDPEFMNRLLANEDIKYYYHQLTQFDSLLKTNETTKEWFSKGQAVYSFHSFQNKDMAFFFAVQTQKEVDSKNALQFFETHFPNRFKLSIRKFLNQEIFDLTDFKEGTQFTIAFKNKLLLFSQDGSLVEMAIININKINTNGVPEDKLSFIKNSGEGINLHIYYKNLPVFLQGTCKEDYQSSFGIIGDFGERAVYNVSYDDEELMLKGAAQTHESNFQYLDLLNAQAPIPNTLRKLLPTGIHFSITFGYNGYDAFFKNVNEYLLNKKLFVPYRSYLDSIEKELNYKFSTKLASNLGNHAALLAIDEPGFWKDSCFLIAIEASKDGGLDEMLWEMENAARIKNSIDSTSINQDTLFEGINKAYLGDAFKFYFTDLFEASEANYYIKKDGYYFFANNQKILSVLYKRWESKSLILTAEKYEEFENKLSPNSNLEILVLNEHMPKFILGYLNNSWFSLLNRNMGTFKRANFMAMQFAGSNDKIFATQIYTHFNLSKPEKTEQVWAIQLDTILATTPQVVYNFGLGENVILAQDVLSQLYMIDRDGKVIWKQKLDGTILSKVYELDLYNNGKRQWLFNTNHTIYLLDGNGNSLPGWPVWIPTSTKFPAVVIDPTLDRNYQILVSGLYYKLMNYSGQGRLLPGWSPKEVWPNWNSEIGSFSYRGKQIYWGKNEKGKLQFLETGAKENLEIKLDSNFYCLDAKIKSIDTNETLIAKLDSFYLEITKYRGNQTSKVTSYPVMGYTKFSMVNNGATDQIYLLQGPHKLGLLNQQGKFILEKNIEDSSYKFATWTYIGNSFQLAYLNTIEDKLIIENINGKPYKPFPIDIKGPFAVGNVFKEADTWLLFTDAENKLNLYRIK